MTDDEHKAACYARYVADRARRRQVAMQIMAGKRGFDPGWPTWKRLDVEAEIDLIEQEEAAVRQMQERKQREWEARERQKEIFQEKL